MIKNIAPFLLILFILNELKAKDLPKSKLFNAIYFSWGYNESWYSKSTISINQPSLNNSYKIVALKGEDKYGFKLIFNSPLTIPQYNIRLGAFIAKHPSWGIELCFDHIKYVAEKNEWVEFRGIINKEKKSIFYLVNDTNFAYQLNNGANMFNVLIIKKIKTFTKNNFKINHLIKFGAGPNYPHVQNTILGKSNTPLFQWSGFNIGAELSNKFIFYNTFYIDLAFKTNYANYKNLTIFEGTAKQSFMVYQFIGSLGVQLNFKN